MSSIPGSPLRALLEASAASPLTEADPASLDELMRRVQISFNKKPLELTDEDIASNVLYYRHQRAKFSQLARQKEAEGPKPRRKPAGSIDEALRRQITNSI